MRKNQVPHNQLNLFACDEPDYDQILTDKATALLDCLNESYKAKDHYLPHYTIQEGNYIILIACNRHKDIVCNVLDVYGNIPKDFSVNWRDISHIKQELAHTLKN